jgi:hypothetical protein
LFYSFAETMVRLTPQSQVLAILGAVGLVLSIGVGIVRGAWLEAILGALIGGLVLLLYIYDVDCTVLGGCDVWAWIKAFVIGLSLAALVVIQTILLFTKPPVPLTPAQSPATPLVPS